MVSFEAPPLALAILSPHHVCKLRPSAPLSRSPSLTCKPLSLSHVNLLSPSLTHLQASRHIMPLSLFQNEACPLCSQRHLPPTLSQAVLCNCRDANLTDCDGKAAPPFDCPLVEQLDSAAWAASRKVRFRPPRFLLSPMVCALYSFDWCGVCGSPRAMGMVGAFAACLLLCEW